MKKMNNKGFSLVELIIVIAIMAILIVVLAPQYLKYVERSRNSTDMQTATEFMDACEVWAADPEATPAFTSTGGTFTISSDTGVDGAFTTANDNTDAATAAITETGLDVSEFKCMSRTRWDNMTISGTVETDGSITWDIQPTELANAMAGN